jgi:hypothetical protein
VYQEMAATAQIAAEVETSRPLRSTTFSKSAARAA